ncbi:hypothetical protein SEA_JOURNEY13_42 [Mycobacterium phage Journey13]|nr:hypothetical protein SEA_JOURNEY13_42 [Mycobacterium phage Journey13]
MAQRATAINMEDRTIICAGEPMLDTDEGVLIIQFEDGTNRIFNWNYVIDYYYMTEDEYAHHRAGRGMFD